MEAPKNLNADYAKQSFHLTLALLPCLTYTQKHGVDGNYLAVLDLFEVPKSVLDYFHAVDHADKYINRICSFK